jgi:hypothetical protein
MVIQTFKLRFLKKKLKSIFIFLMCITYWILIKTIWNEMILKSEFEFSCKSKTIVHDFTSKVHYYMCGVYLLNLIIMYIFLFKLAIIVHNIFATLMILPYIYGISIKYILQKFQRHTKNESPYLAINILFQFLMIILNCCFDSLLNCSSFNFL